MPHTQTGTSLVDEVAARLRDGGYNGPVRSRNARDVGSNIIRTVLSPPPGAYWSDTVVSVLVQIVEGPTFNGHVSLASTDRFTFRWKL